MPHFYFGKTSDVGLVVIFTNRKILKQKISHQPEKSELDETATEQVERQFGSCSQRLFVSVSQSKQREVLGRLQQASAFILELFNTLANDPDDGMQSVNLQVTTSFKKFKNKTGMQNYTEAQEIWLEKLC